MSYVTISLQETQKYVINNNMTIDNLKYVIYNNSMHVFKKYVILDIKGGCCYE